MERGRTLFIFKVIGQDHWAFIILALYPGGQPQGKARTMQPRYGDFIWKEEEAY